MASSKDMPPVGEQADQLRDDHRGVGVVDLDDHMLEQLLQGDSPAPPAPVRMSWAPADTMKYCWYTRSSRPASVAVVGIEERRSGCGGYRALSKSDALFHQGFVHGFQIKQVQLVDTIFIPGNIQVCRQHRGGLSFRGGAR